jgi:hypothetical protein
MSLRPLALVAALALAIATPAAAKTPFLENQAGAIEGWDPVTYFTTGKPRPGSFVLRFKHSGTVWHFVSKENREKFKASPESYEPQYGGWCAKAMAEGLVHHGEPKIWLLLEGKLYFFEDEATRKAWTADSAEMIAEADEAWPAIADRLAHPEREQVERRKAHARTVVLDADAGGSLAIHGSDDDEDDDEAEEDDEKARRRSRLLRRLRRRQR